MRHYLGFAIFVLLFLILYVSPSESQESCINCHDDYAKIWSKSVHSEAGVSCSKCMGGDPTKVDKELAHKGVKPASDPESMIYYKNIPFTCGACHQQQLEHFKGSTHYKNLEGNRLAPDCRTCHGSMGIVEVVPIKISEKCQLCHNPEVGAPTYIPGQAKRLFLLQEQITGEINRAEIAVYNAKQVGRDVTAGEESLSRAREVMMKSAEVWHKFDLKDFENELYDALYYAYRAENQVGAPPAFPVQTQPPTKSICGPTVVLLLASLTVLGARKFSAS